MRMQFSKLALTAALTLAIAFTFSCSGGDSGDGPSGGGGSCSINGGTVKIGTQTWMAENLNCNVTGSKCYDNDPANCAKYGRLYDWATARKACPSGWRLPSDDEWDELISYVESNNGCSDCAGKHLKAKSGWNSGGNGIDTYGFSALPGGFGFSIGNFDYVGNSGYWWGASEGYSSNAYFRRMHDDDEAVYWGYVGKSYFYSVRCLKD